MELPLSLEMEQEFNLTRYKRELDDMDIDETKDIAIELMRQLMLKNNVVKHLIKHGSGIPPLGNSEPNRYPF
jgi:hypothetical protein